MRKIFLALSFVLVFSLCGCSKSDTSTHADDDKTHTRDEDSLIKYNDIESMDNWSFQYNEGTNDYSVFFGLLNKKGKYVSADVDVDIRIVNDEDEVVYEGTKSVSKKDFGYYTSNALGERYLAEVRIPSSEITPGKSSDGKVFITVHKSNIIDFSEVNCDALYCLPIGDVQLNFDSLPIELKVMDWNGDTKSIIQINDVSYKFEKEYIPELKITISGEKTYGDSSSLGYDIIGYKLYDSDGNMVDASHIYLSSLSKGDKFKDDSIVFYDVIPGETYSLKFVVDDSL